MITLHITKTLSALKQGQAVRFDSSVIWESAQTEKSSAILDNAPSVKEHAEHLAKMQGVTAYEVEGGRQWEFFKSLQIQNFFSKRVTGIALSKGTIPQPITLASTSDLKSASSCRTLNAEFIINL